jgi:hypothetical protein
MKLNKFAEKNYEISKFTRQKTLTKKAVGKATA